MGEAGADASGASDNTSGEAAETKEEAPQETPAAKADTQREEQPADNADVIASPATRKRARELGIDLSKVQARDPLGRIRPEDVDTHAKGTSEQKEAKPAKKKNRSNRKKTTFDKPVERVKNVTPPSNDCKSACECTAGISHADNIQ